MSYKIAVASSDGVNIDLSFGAAQGFLVYEADEINYQLIEHRKYDVVEDTENSCKFKAECGTGTSCNTGAGCGTGIGCGEGHSAKVDLIADCRCILCKKIGFQVQKQLEKRAITSFDIACPIEDALNKIIAYLEKVDNHKSLRGIQRLGS